MTFKFVSIFHDFPGNFIFPGFSMIFHDRGNPEWISVDRRWNDCFADVAWSFSFLLILQRN